MRMLTHILAALLAIAVWSCGGRRDTRLERVDALVCADPEAALSVLDSINPDALTDPDRAWFALLRAKAADKSYRHIENDSLIGFAADYFAGRGDSLEIQALYYLGYGLSHDGELDRALIPLHEAYEKAMTHGDWAYAAMSARATSVVYGKLNLFDKKFDLALTAKELFKLSGRNLHSLWMDLIIVQTQISRGRYTHALAMADSILKETKITDENFLRQLNLALAEIYDGLNLPDSVINIYTRIHSNGIRLTAEDWCRIADNNLKLDLIDVARAASDSAKLYQTTKSDSLYTQYVVSKLLGNIGDYEKGYREAMSFGEEVLRESDQLLTSPRILLLNEYLVSKSKEAQVINERNELRLKLMVLICGLLILCVILISGFFRESRKRNHKQSLLYLSTIEDLNKRLIELISVEESRHDYDLEKKLNSDNISTESIKVMSEILALDSGIGEAMKKNGQEGMTRRGLITVINRLKDSSFTDKLGRAIDSVHNGWASELREICPKITDSQYRLALYLFLGLSSGSIMELLDKMSQGSFYTSKSRLKAMLKESNDARSSQYLIDLGFE